MFTQLYLKSPEDNEKDNDEYNELIKVDENFKRNEKQIKIYFLKLKIVMFSINSIISLKK